MGDLMQGVRRKKLVKKAGLPRHVKDMSKEQLEATIRKKRECNAKALIIVEQMLETPINEVWFLNQLKFIDVGHFQDIIEERALSKLCGYPLCSENLKSFPSQQFRISTKYNKVYDITERKNFCCNQCYKASKFVKDQLLTSPLWIRDKEDTPVFKLLPVGSQGTGAGEEVDLGQNNNLKSEIVKLNIDEKFVSVADYTQESISVLSKKIDDIEIREKDKSANGDKTHKGEKLQNESRETQNQSGSDIQKGTAKQEEKEMINSKSEENTSSKTEKQKELETLEEKESECNILSPKSQLPVNNVVNSDYGLKNNSSKSNNEENSKEQKKDKKKKHVNSYESTEVTSSVIHIEKCLNEWFSIETMCFLLGEDKVKDIVSDKGECIKEYYKAVGKSSWDPEVQQQYEAICRRLNIMEMQEEQYDKEERKLKPLPDYSVLKEESLKLDFKIQSFFQGRTDYEIPVNLNEENRESVPSCILPLVDIHAQNALRRRMVFDNLKRVLPDLLRSLGLSSRDISSEVRCLIGSFRLSAHNITFNPAEWNLLGLIIIKMLSIKDIRLKMLLETQQGIKHQTMLLMAFQQDGGYLERLMVWLTDLDNIMKKTNLQNIHQS